MNLITGEWIPVIFDDGVQRDVGLRELYEKSRDIRDLVLNPPQRISVMRLLICITQAALDGPENERDWLNCENRIIPESIKYLDERMDLFNLYGENRFLQFDRLEANEWKVLDKLDFSSPSASTLFEHSASSEYTRKRNDAWKAINLITLLNFHTTGKVGQAILDKKNYNFSTKPTPCIGHSHTFVKGNILLETIYYNLLTKKEVLSLPNGEWGKPIWDYFPSSAADSEAIKNAAETYLGRLVPLSRLIFLDQSPNSTQCIIGPTPETIEYEQLPSFREPTTTVLIGKSNKSYYMSISSEKHIWRDLGSILSLSKGTGAGSAVVLNKILIIPDASNNKAIDIWIGGLELGEQAAKLSDMVEWNLSLPIKLFGEPVLLSYQNGVEKAIAGENALRGAVNSYRRELKIESQLFQEASLKYWQFLDNYYQVLIDTACDESKSIEDDWSKLINEAMDHAYQATCAHETPRQIQAFVAGKKILVIRKDQNEKSIGNKK